MGFARSMISNAAGMARGARQGDGFLAFLSPQVVATDVNHTLTVPQFQAGCIQFTSWTAGRNITTPTAAQILAANPDMDIGDSLTIAISVVPAFAGTYVAGTNVTLAGRATTPASSYSLIVVTKLSATTVEWRVL